LELAGAVRRIVTEIDKDQPVADIATMEQAIDRALAGRRLSTLLVGLFAGLAVVLAAIGVFGLVSYAVTCRTNEIGIRMALGARRSGILAMITRETLAFGLGGVAVGIAGSLGTSRLLASMLYEVKPAAPHILLASAAFLVATMIFATLFAARRAIGVDPVVALRQE
jgi:putative ABC transport system permease protein